MKTLFLKSSFLLALLFPSHETTAQTLANTKWKVYNNGNFFYYFRFHNDTISYSSNNIAYTSVSTYTQVANSFTVVDIGSSAACPPGTQGRYTFTIQNDTLKWTLINDPCAMRSPVFTTYDWFDIYMSLNEWDKNKHSILVYPNPAADFLHVEAEGLKEIEIINMQGSLVKKLSISGKDVPVKELPPGNYFMRILIDGKMQAKKQFVHTAN